MAENGGFDLSSILQNEEMVQQLRQMAGSMGLSDQLEDALRQQPASGVPPSSVPHSAPPSRPASEEKRDRKGSGTLPLSPQMIAAFTKIAQAMNQEGPETRFLQSLGPLLKPERRPRVEEAVQILRMVQALQSVEGSGGLGNLLGGLMGQR